MAKARTDRAPQQRERFVSAARALGADEDEAAFRAKLAVIARQKPAPEPPKAKPKKRLRKTK